MICLPYNVRCIDLRYSFTVKHDYSEHAYIESLAFRYLRVLHYIIVLPMSYLEKICHFSNFNWIGR